MKWELGGMLPEKTPKPEKIEQIYQEVDPVKGRCVPARQIFF